MSCYALVSTSCKQHRASLMSSCRRPASTVARCWRCTMPFAALAGGASSSSVRPCVTGWAFRCRSMLVGRPFPRRRRQTRRTTIGPEPLPITTVCCGTSSIGSSMAIAISPGDSSADGSPKPAPSYCVTRTSSFPCRLTVGGCSSGDSTRRRSCRASCIG